MMVGVMVYAPTTGDVEDWVSGAVSKGYVRNRTNNNHYAVFVLFMLSLFKLAYCKRNKIQKCFFRVSAKTNKHIIVFHNVSS